MGFLKNRSIYSKLVIIQMLTAVLVVLLVSGSFVYMHFQEFKSEKVTELKSITRLISTNSASAIIFNDSEAANEILDDLKSNKEIVYAEIQTPDGSNFARYSKNNKQQKIHLPNSNKVFSFSFQDDFLYVRQMIDFQGEHVGTLFLKSEIKDLEIYLQKRINIALVLTLIGIMMAFILAMILQKSISKPIYKLLGVMDQVKMDSNYSVRSEALQKDEIGKLSQVFNEMLDQIEKKNQILSENNKTLTEKVKERTQELEKNNEKLSQTNEELVKAKIHAEESKAVKELFLANISHEIRTPLNSIIGFQQLLKNTELSQNQLEYVLAIDFAGKNLLALINDILDLSKIESGKLHFEDKEFDLNETITAVIDLLKQRVIDKDLELRVNLDPDTPAVLIGDSTRFSQILINLIGNAIKFTNAGYIELSTKVLSQNDQDLHFHFQVKDTGIGIDEKHLPFIFDRFTQGGEDTTRLYGGTGLGLTICKYLVEGFGGSLSVSSKRGEGTCFEFDLVLKKSISKKLSVKTEEHRLLQHIQRLNVLLVEDVAINQRLMVKVLNSWGFDFKIASNGKEALDLIESNVFDIVLMDIQMPEMNGFEATEKIRKMSDPKKRNIPIIALTAQASNAESDKCLESGMNDYVTKPFDQQHLLHTILNLVFPNERPEASSTRVQIHAGSFFDFTLLYEKADGDLIFLKEMFESYTENMPSYLQELELALQEKNVTQLAEITHKMKSPLALFGANKFVEMITEFERENKNDALDESWLPRLEKLLVEVRESVAFLEAEISKISLV